jgi:DNA-binding IclR family transcriptional regulator
LCIAQNIKGVVSVGKKNDNISSARKVLQIIDIMSQKNGELSVTQLAKLLDCSISSTNRFLSTMRTAGYVDKSSVTNRYYLTNRLIIACNDILNNNHTLKTLIELAYIISQKYNVSVNINTMYNYTPLMLYRITTLYNKDLNFLIGDTAPAYCSSAGKAMLSLYSRTELDKLFETLEIRPYQHQQLTLESVRAEIGQAAKTGFAVCDEEFVSGVFSISFPLRDSVGDVYALTLITTMRGRKYIYTAEVINYVKARLQELDAK